ncbi:Stk1 family PASTA domain-containing Ser/Thr kinase [Peptoanaerobacter stomatis]|uniref:Stk1 family PASTA domain-containing Ser/Thr kinase n=1 Tax=Peptoanaerobacter stomatis TaxID=796937 RepID=UPI003FA00C0E
MDKIILGNRYELLEKIADGGMSTVYKAYCHTLNRVVAVKILKPEFSKDEEFLIKFNNEAKAAASLNHANIINIYDVCQEDDIAYIVMEYVDGINLKQLITKKGKFSEKEALDILRQICSALREAHKNKIVHRDIKPHNIMINKDNIVKVGDFGIAKAATSATITTVGGVIGSVHYFSPEQARGGYMDERSDIYSLGVVFYELLTGEIPYDGDSPINVALKHLHENITIPEEYKDKISPSVKNMLLKMTQKNMDKRYASVDQIVSDIAKIQDGNSDIKYFDREEDFNTRIIKLPKEKIKENSDKNKIKIKKRKIKKLPVTILGIIIILVIMFVMLIINGGNIFDAIHNTNTTIIPDIKGKTIIEAQKDLEKSDLKLKIMSEKEDDTQKEGTILEQNPESGVKMRKGEEVSVVVAKEPQNIVIVPSVVDKEEKEAKSILEQANLKSSVDYEFNDNVEKNHVISQDPSSDVKSKIDDVIKLKVSKGKEVKQEKIPSFIGMNLDYVESNIGNFKIGNVSYEEDTSKKEGTVLYQNPKADTTHDVGTEIDFVINKLSKSNNENNNTSSVSNLQIPLSKTITLVLPQKDSLLLSVLDKSDNTVVYTATISTAVNQNVDITLSAYLGQTKVYDIYINGEYYSTTGEIVFN